MDIHIVIAVWRGVFDHAKAFKTRPQADAYAAQLKESSPSSMDYDVTVTTEEVQ